MSVLIKVVGFANGSPCPIAGQYLKTFDFDAHDGLGYGEFTYTKSEAMRFAGNGEALAYWRTTSKLKPTREDGKPNRPLSATTVELVKYP